METHDRVYFFVRFLLTNREIIASLSIRPEVSLTSSQYAGSGQYCEQSQPIFAHTRAVY